MRHLGSSEDPGCAFMTDTNPSRRSPSKADLDGVLSDMADLQGFLDETASGWLSRRTVPRPLGFRPRQGT